MQTMPISQFKAHALKVIDQVARDHNSNILITKRGKPLARIIPYEEDKQIAKPGQLTDTLIFAEDIISPLGEEMWQACS